MWSDVSSGQGVCEHSRNDWYKGTSHTSKGPIQKSLDEIELVGRGRGREHKNLEVRNMQLYSNHYICRLQKGKEAERKKKYFLTTEPSTIAKSFPLLILRSPTKPKHDTCSICDVVADSGVRSRCCYLRCVARVRDGLLILPSKKLYPLLHLVMFI